MRPVGGWLMGLYADRKGGRKAALMASVLLMCAGSRMIALTPRVRPDRLCGTGAAAVRAIVAGSQRRWRVRHLRDLPQ